jgi:hypothetical protein
MTKLEAQKIIATLRETASAVARKADALPHGTPATTHAVMAGRSQGLKDAAALLEDALQITEYDT